MGFFSEIASEAADASARRTPSRRARTPAGGPPSRPARFRQARPTAAGACSFPPRLCTIGGSAYQPAPPPELKPRTEAQGAALQRAPGRSMRHAGPNARPKIERRGDEGREERPGRPVGSIEPLKKRELLAESTQARSQAIRFVHQQSPTVVVGIPLLCGVGEVDGGGFRIFSSRRGIFDGRYGFLFVSALEVGVGECPGVGRSQKRSLYKFAFLEKGRRGNEDGVPSVNKCLL